MGDQDHIGENLRAYIQAFSPSVRDIFASFEIHAQIDRLTKANLLYLVTEKFATIDLHPEVVSNAQMGAVFEELIRKFAELSNETAGEHFTPREVIRLMVNLLFIEDDDALNKPVVRTLYDPTAGTGGMLSVASEYLAEHNAKARLTMYGQELNPESYAICKADMLIKGQDIANICFGNTLSADGLPGKHFDYMLSNPPFGVEWRKIEKEIRTEADKLGYNGRFGPGLPRVSDGSLLFLLHLVSKMRPIADGGSRFGIVLNGSPLFTGGAGSGESEIRRYVLENDLVEAIISLPVDMFYNTGISTYVWIVSNRKPAARKGTVQLIDASGMWQKMRKSLGSKRKELSPAHIEDITRLFGDGVAVSRPGEDGRPVPISRVFRNTDFGYRTITVERPLRDAAGAIVLGTKGAGKGKPVADSDLRDTENVPLSEDVEVYFRREVLPHAPDAWIDHEKTKVGYEIPFNRHFYVFKPPRPLSEIDAELKGVTDRIRYLQSLHIKNNEVVFNTPYFVSPEWSSQHAKSILETGDVLIVQTGDIGQSAVVTDEFAGCNCHALIVVAPVRSVVDGEWIAWALNSEYGLHTLLSIQTGALHPHLNCGDVKDVALPLPSMQEQKNIVSYIKERSRIFDNLTSEAHRAITLLQERRTALISAAVTGQIDVRHLADTSAA
jgi:type I restriction enzyme M protein